MNTAQKTILFVLTYFLIQMGPMVILAVTNWFVDPQHVWLCMMPDVLFYGWNIAWAFLALGFTNEFWVRRWKYSEPWIAGGAK